MTDSDSARHLVQPTWLSRVLDNPKKIWETWPLLLEREEQRAEARARSRENLESNDEQNPYSVWSATILDESRKKHRFHVEAYDRNRVIVGLDPSRYCNASFVREGAGGRWWIAAEAPMSSAAHAFLSLFIPPNEAQEDQHHSRSRQQREYEPERVLRPPRIHTIVQLSPANEGSAHPPDPYYPHTLSHQWTIHPERGCDLPPLQVQTVKQKRISRANCTQTTFLVSRPTVRSQYRESESFEVVHLLFESWPAKSIPNSDAQHALEQLMHVVSKVNMRPQYSLDQMDDLEYEQQLQHPTDPPILVHCAEGGRTGTFIALNSLLRSYKCLPSPYDETHHAPRIPQSPLGPASSEIALDPVLREFDHLMDQRSNIVDNENQVRFVYQMLSDAITERQYSQNTHFRPIAPQTSPQRAQTLQRKTTKSSGGSRRGRLSVENVWLAIRGR